MEDKDKKPKKLTLITKFEEEFWAQVYVVSIRSNFGQPEDMADKAIELLRERTFEL